MTIPRMCSPYFFLKHAVLQVFLRYDDEEALLSLAEDNRRHVIRVQSCIRRWAAVRRVCCLRQLLHSQATRIQAGKRNQQGVALTGRNNTGPPAIIRLTLRHRLACAGETASCLIIARRGVECYRRRRQTTDDDTRQRAKQYWLPTLSVGGPVITHPQYISDIIHIFVSPSSRCFSV